MKVAFCGHREVYAHEKVRAWLENEVGRLILDGADRFYLGGYGQFDSLAAAVVRKQKERYPQIRSVLVIPYLDREVDSAVFDEIVYPPLETVPKRYAISKRNEYMVDQADVLIAYVNHNYGGAYITMCYAEKKHKGIIRYGEV